jgi:hypothetical protein
VPSPPVREQFLNCGLHHRSLPTPMRSLTPRRGWRGEGKWPIIRAQRERGGGHSCVTPICYRTRVEGTRSILGAFCGRFRVNASPDRFRKVHNA